MLKNLLISSLFAFAMMTFYGCAEKPTTTPSASSMGVGKCGIGMQGKCGTGKCGADIKAEGMKCGTGKCGSTDKAASK